MRAVVIPTLPLLGGLTSSRLIWGFTSYGLQKIRVFRGKKEGRFMRVVSTAAQFDVLGGCHAADGERDEVVEFQESAFGTSAV